MPINYNYKTIFIHIPKCAGTSVEFLLDTLNETNLYTQGVKTKNSLCFDKFTDEEYRICASKNMQHYTFRELKKVLPEEIITSFKKFSIVRNPYDRLVSEFYFAITPYKDFEEFVKNVLSLDVYTRNWLYDGHIETQSSFLINEQNNFNSIDNIFKYEQLDECFAFLKNITGKSAKPHLKKTQDREPWQNYYTTELKEIVYNFYRDDFINFNYGT
jgi:hypothetical protein